MSLSNYCLCNACGSKVFYDANLGSDYLEATVFALCEDCEKTHTLQVQRRAPPGKWLVHISGPDDIIECESLASALLQQLQTLAAALYRETNGKGQLVHFWANIIAPEPTIEIYQP